MCATILPFAPPQSFVEIERMGRDQNGRGQANGVWDGHTLADAMVAAEEWRLPIQIHPSAHQTLS